MSLIVKPGGSFTHKSGASFGVKGSALPPYVIDGLEQSHWLMENAVVSGGIIQSIPDSSGSNVTLLPSYTTGVSAISYGATGWQLNGKTLPIAVGAPTARSFSAPAWASKLNNYTGAFTVATLVSLDTANSNQSRTFVAGAPAVAQYHNGFRSGMWTTLQRPDFTANDTAGVSGKVIILEEYAGNNVATPEQQFRLWVNGSSRTLTTSGTGGRVPIPFTVFSVGGLDPWNPADGAYRNSIAQFHIWKGALTTAQRDSVTAYLKSISGIA